MPKGRKIGFKDGWHQFLRWILGYVEPLDPGFEAPNAGNGGTPSHFEEEIAIAIAMVSV